MSRTLLPVYLALTILLAASRLRAADFDTSMPDLGVMKKTSGQAPKASASPVICGDADLSPFLRRLEDMGLSTEGIRALASKISVSYRAPSASANAQWGYIRKILYLPDTFKESGSQAVRYDLRPDEISTTIHELTHAEYSMIASADAAAGSAAKEHYDAVQSIWADVRSEAFFVTYAGSKADEVSGYFMGAAISEVADAVGDIVLYNTFKGGSKASDAGSALLLPTAENAADDYEKALAARAKKPFGTVSVCDVAMFEGKLVGWEERPPVKTQMYSHILGLNPPKDPQELLARLNASNGDWIQGVREKVLAARRRNSQPRP
jgi:hypothetical protein